MTTADSGRVYGYGKQHFNQHAAVALAAILHIGCAGRSLCGTPAYGGYTAADVVRATGREPTVCKRCQQAAVKRWGS